MTTKEKRNEYMRKYYLLHKEEIDARNKKWRQENKDKFYECVKKCKKRKAEKLKSEGVKYYWLSDNARKKRNTERDTRID